MRKTSPLIVILLIVFAAASAFLFIQNRTNSATLRALRTEQDNTRTQYDRALDDIATIQDSLSAIALDDTGPLKSSALRRERALNPNRGDETLERVAELRAGIQRAKDRIRRLETRLGESGAKVAGLERMLTRLKQNLSEKERTVAQLTGQVDSLQTSVAGLTSTVQANESRIRDQEAALEERRRELGTLYYIIGTRDELVKAGIVVATGGFLGLGRTLLPAPNVNEARFQALDTDQQSTITVAAARAQVITAQPASSYQLVPVEKQLELRIVDVREFRKVRHLIVVTG
ncbi:MAG: hypothetical protein ABL977_12210 [Candidatus Eisenbacteria bacterium]